MGEKEKQELAKMIKSIIGIAIIVIILIITVFTMIISAIFVVCKDDVEKISEKNETYNIEIDRSGEVKYVKTVEVEEDSDKTASEETKSEEEVSEETNKEATTPKEMAEDFKNILGKYINAEKDEEYIEKVTYLIEAETVTKIPYIEGASTQGKIEFYRFNSDTEAEPTKENQLTFVNEEKFGEFKSKFESSGDETVFKHFTIDSEGQMIIAYGQAEKKKVTTNGDPDVTLDVVKEASGDSEYAGNHKEGFYVDRYIIDTRPVEYKSLIEMYTMPSNLLYSLLIQTGDIDFVESIASLAYDTKIQIGIYDNESTSYIQDQYTYKKIVNTEVTTSLDFSSLNIKNPPLSEEQLKNISGLKIPSMCYASISKDANKHTRKYKNAESEQTDIAKNLYIKDINEDGIKEISEEGSAKEFIVDYRQDIESKSSAFTVDIVSADTWIAKWSTKYQKEATPYGPNPDSGEYEDEELALYASNDEFQNAFAGDLKSSISAALDKHKTELREEAINDIYESKKNDIQFKALTAETVSTLTQTLLLGQHINECKTCKAILKEKNVDVKDAFDEIIKEDGLLRNTKVAENFYNKILPGHVQTYNAIEKGKLEYDFEEALKADGAITCSQTVTASKYNIDIKFSSESGSTRTTYKKEGEIERAEDGEKFSTIFNDSQYIESRKAILARTEWLWEYIRMNEDTKNLEYVLRYLLNIATGTTDFGDFTEEEIKEILGALEPTPGSLKGQAGIISPFGCSIERDEFIESVRNYNGGNAYYKLADAAEDFYDVCTSKKYNVNPCLAFAWACMETGYGGSIPNNNLFGMAVYNGANSGTSYSSYAKSIEDFCEWVIKNSTSNSTANRAEEFATVNSKFVGTAENNIYILFCRYMYLGDIHYSDEPDFNNPAGTEYYKANGSTWGQGGRIYLYHMYELRSFIYR